MLKRFVAVLIAMGLFATACAADQWPPRSITLVVGFGAGGNTDLAARILANAMKASLPVPVVVENKPGAGGTVGAAYVSRSAANGGTLLVASQSETTMLKSNRLKPPYDLDRDFVPIAKLMDQDYVLVVPASLNLGNWKEFVAYAKAQGSITYATSGIGTTAHVMSEHLAKELGIKAVHVPYTGAAAFRADLVAGRVDFSIDVVPLSMPLISAGKLRPIAVTQKARDQRLPNVPSLVELGVFREQYAGWTGVFAPRGTPLEVQARLREQVDQMLRGSGGQEISNNGYRPASQGQGPNDFAQFVASDQKKWQAAFQRVGIQPSP